jgi:hypothetical protein
MGVSLRLILLKDFLDFDLKYILNCLSLDLREIPNICPNYQLAVLTILLTTFEPEFATKKHYPGRN